jgi:phosphohistidine phosphatase
MRRLILFRHAKAEPRGADMEDFDRPLAPRGREDAALVGRVLARMDLAPDLALVSTARRAAETWLFARDAFPTAKGEPHPELYEAAPATIREAVNQAAARAQTLMVVAHNPGLHELAISLLREASAPPVDIGLVAARFPTGVACVLLIDEHGRASLDDFILPKAYGGEAG